MALPKILQTFVYNKYPLCAMGYNPNAGQPANVAKSAIGVVIVIAVLPGIIMRRSII